MTLRFLHNANLLWWKYRADELLNRRRKSHFGSLACVEETTR